MHINARVGTLHFAFFRSLMRCQKKLLIRDFAVDFCFAKIAVLANHVFAAQKWFDYPTRPKQKQTIGKRSFIKRIRARVGTVRSRIFRTPRAFSGKSRVLPTTQSAAAARRCGCFGEPYFCCAKMVRLSDSSQTKKDHREEKFYQKDKSEGGYGALPHFPNAASV